MVLSSCKKWNQETQKERTTKGMQTFYIVLVIIYHHIMFLGDCVYGQSGRAMAGVIVCGIFFGKGRNLWRLPELCQV